MGSTSSIGATLAQDRPPSKRDRNMIRPKFIRSLVLLGQAAFLAACPSAPPSEDPSLDQILSEERPGKRSEVIAVADDVTEKILMFGGNEAPIVNQIPLATYTGETWLFEPSYGWTELAIDGPHERGRYGAALDPREGRALLFGGRFRPEGQSGDYDLFDDLWAFDFESQEWTLLDDGTEGGPAARYYPQVAWSTEDNALYVYGGLTNNDPLIFQRSSELWRWTEEDGWEEQETEGNAPSPRAFYGSTYDGSRNRLVLFAGQVGDFQSLAFNDLFSLDLSTGTWTELHGGGRARRLPECILTCSTTKLAIAS